MNREPKRLLLDEMISPLIAAELRLRGHDVVAVAADPAWRALADAEIYARAGEDGRRVITENVKDFRPLLTVETGPGVVFSSSRRFPRSRRNVGPIVDALDRWLATAAEAAPPVEDWLR